MRTVGLILIQLFTCAITMAQVNFVKNSDLEEYWHCPTDWNQIDSTKYWSNAIDSAFFLATEYFNGCAGSNIYAGITNNVLFHQEPHSGSGMAGIIAYYDGMPPDPPAPLPKDYRDYLQGRLVKPLVAGESYCVTLYVNNTEASAYGQNRIGAFFDNGSFDDTVSKPGSAMTFVTPQVYTTDVISDTGVWTKIEGSFIANGTETYITIGNFFKNVDVTVVPMPSAWGERYSYFLIDDVSVIEIDLAADAGPDVGTVVGGTVQIGRVSDTTAKGLDCKWYHKGSLIDSGAIVTVPAATLAGIIDTYAVVQTICGNVKTDTVLVHTFSVGIHDPSKQLFRVYPNPSEGTFFIDGPAVVSAIVYDLSGRILYQNENVGNRITISFTNSESVIKPDLPDGTYILELGVADGGIWRKHISIKK